jgi:hypothetical protein
MRREYKEERRGLGERSHFCVRNFLQEVKGEEENGENRSFWKLSQRTDVPGNFGLGG